MIHDPPDSLDYCLRASPLTVDGEPEVLFRMTNPQYHAEKTTATHARWYGLWSPRSGTSALRSRSAATAARTASTYRKAFWLGSLGSDSSKTCNQRFRISDLEFELPTAQSNLFQE